MSDSPPTPETPRPRLHKEYEDPHFHDEDDMASVEEDEPHGSHTKPPPRRKPAYRPRRRFEED